MHQFCWTFRICGWGLALLTAWGCCWCTGFSLPAGQAGAVAPTTGSLKAGHQPPGERQRSAPPKAKSPADLKAAVRKLIRELSSAQRRVRVRAESELLKLGPGVLPHLPPPDLLPDVSVREAVLRVRVRLEQTAAKRSVEPSHVTLTGKFTVAKALAEFARQTGNRIDGSKLPRELSRKQVTVDYRHATFWAAVTDLSRRANVVVAATSDGDGLSARPRGKTSRPIAVDTRTAFRIAVTSLQWKPLVGDAGDRLLRVRWELSAEPRLRPLFVTYTGKGLTATTDAGKQLAPFDPDASFELTVSSGSPLQLDSDFVVPKSETVKQVAFGGKLKVLTAGGQQPVTFGELLKSRGAAKRRGGVTVTLKNVKRRDLRKPGAQPQERLSVSLSVSYDTGGPAFESHRTWIFHNRVYLQSPDGKRIPPQPGFSTLLQRDGAVGVGYHFAIPRGAAGKMQFVYVAPTLLIDVPVELKFEKIPTPSTPRKETR